MFKHVARCDAKACSKEASLKWSNSTLNTLTVSGAIQTVINADHGTYSLPEKWITVESEHFCSWTCVAQRAAEKAENDRGE